MDIPAYYDIRNLGGINFATVRDNNIVCKFVQLLVLAVLANDGLHLPPSAP